jgi:hypothetical protein
MNTRRALRALLLCLGALFFAAPIPAQELAMQRDAHGAGVLFDEGRQALARKDFTTACAKFSESYRVQAAAGTAMNWATCEEQLGHLATAWWRWNDAISLLHPGDDRLAYVERQVRRLDSRLPYLSVSLAPAAPFQTAVLRDGVPLRDGRLGLTLPVDPGEHQISVSAPGYADRRFSITVAEREQKALVVEPGAKLASLKTPDAVAPSPPATQRTVGWIACGVGAAGFATAAVTGLMLPAKQQAVSENCVNHVCNQTGLDAAKAGDTLQTMNTIGWVAGIVAGGLGAYLVISSPSSAAGRPRAAVGLSSARDGLTVRYVSTF